MSDTFKGRSKQPWPEPGRGDQASRSQERAGVLADARAAVEWAYANDDCAELRHRGLDGLETGPPWTR